MVLLWYHVMPTLVPIASREQKTHVTPHFNCLEIRNAVVPLMMALTLSCTNKYGNGVT